MASEDFTKEAAQYARENLDQIMMRMTHNMRDSERPCLDMIHRFITIAEEAAPSESDVC